MASLTGKRYVSTSRTEIYTVRLTFCCLNAFMSGKLKVKGNIM